MEKIMEEIDIFSIYRADDHHYKKVEGVGMQANEYYEAYKPNYTFMFHLHSLN